MSSSIPDTQLTAIVLHEIKTGRSHNDIIRLICSHTGWDWQEATDYFRSVQAKHKKELERALVKWRLVAVVPALAILLAVILAVITHYADATDNRIIYDAQWPAEGLQRSEADSHPHIRGKNLQLETGQTLTVHYTITVRSGELRISVIRRRSILYNPPVVSIDLKESRSGSLEIPITERDLYYVEVVDISGSIIHPYRGRIDVEWEVKSEK